MDINFRDVELKSINESYSSGGRKWYNVHLDDIDTDDLLSAIAGDCTSSDYIDKFLTHHLQFMDLFGYWSAFPSNGDFDSELAIEMINVIKEQIEHEYRRSK